MKLILISAMYENGGNVTHRFLDGHPELFVYPFESQLGTKYVNDYLSHVFPSKYRWPVFPLSSSIEELYNLIIDEETKVRIITPHVSKFRHTDIQLSNENRKRTFSDLLSKSKLSQKSIVQAFFESTFASWGDYAKTGREQAYVGYSPIIIVDGDQIVKDFGDDVLIIHIVRNPFSAFADTKKRPTPLSLEHYCTAWNLCQQFALILQKKFPKNVSILKYEDLISDPMNTLSRIIDKAGIINAQSLNYPSFNGRKLEQVYPWGTIKIPTQQMNFDTACELSMDEIENIADFTALYFDVFGYQQVYNKIKQI